MKLKQALKRKNKLTSLINQEFSKVQRYNSIVKNTSCPYDVKEAYDKYTRYIDELITLKTNISKANLPVQDKIYKLSEYKSMVKNLRSIPTDEGIQVGRTMWDSTTPESTIKIATFNVLAIDEMITRLEERIENIQDDLDYFNQVTEI